MVTFDVVVVSVVDVVKSEGAAAEMEEKAEAAPFVLFMKL